MMVLRYLALLGALSTRQTISVVGSKQRFVLESNWQLLITKMIIENFRMGEMQKLQGQSEHSFSLQKNLHKPSQIVNN